METLGTTVTSVNALGPSGTHTVFLIDLLLDPMVTLEETLFTQTMDTILAFGCSMLSQSAANKLSILGSSSVANRVLYVDQLARTQLDGLSPISGGQMESFANLTRLFHRNLSQWIGECSKRSTDKGSVNGSMLSGALSQSLCLLNRHKAEFTTSRIIIFSLTASSSSANNPNVDRFSSQYMSLINCFFAGQKSSILFDAVSLNLSPSSALSEAPGAGTLSASMECRYAASILQQGVAELTGGRFIQIHQISSLLQTLFWLLSPSSAERASVLVLPAKPHISPPAACFFHRSILQSGTGYVCSVCLSIFCEYTPYCSTCQSNVFSASLKKIAELQSAGDEKSL